MCDELDYETASNTWRYNPDTGQLFWLKKRPKVPHSMLAGTLNCNKRVIVGLKGKRYYAHRIAWLLVEKKQAPAMIDHVNGDSSDNRLVNLRLATNTENQGNRTKAPIGVTRRPYNRFESSIRINGKKKYLGVFSTASEANAAYVKAHIETHGNYSSFAGRL